VKPHFSVGQRQHLLDDMNREWPIHILHLFETEESIFRISQREQLAGSRIL
jgi:hypothetical protein